MWKNFRKEVLQLRIEYLLIAILLLHLVAMNYPSGPTEYVFDESYYVPAAHDLLNFIPSNLEHPFLGKVWGALGISIFGNDPFGWRILYVLFGVGAVWVFYELALNFLDKEKAFFATAFLAFETLFFIHTSLFLLEGPPIFFALLGFLLYFRKSYSLSAVCFGLSILNKEWGIYFAGALLLYHLWTNKKTILKRKFSFSESARLVEFAALIFLVVSIPLWIYDIVYQPYTSTALVKIVSIVNPEINSTSTTTENSTIKNYITNPLQNFEYYSSYQSSLTISQNDTQNKWDHYAWSWILPTVSVNASKYYETAVTVTKAVNGVVTSVSQSHPIQWLGIGNLFVWYSIWLTLAVILVKLFSRKMTKLDIFILAWIIATYLPSLYLSAVVHRVVYAFYFINVDPALALGIPMSILFLFPKNLKLQRILLLIWLIAAIAFFVYFFPINLLNLK